MRVEKREGFVISHTSGPGHTQTGQLERRTLLHKRYLIQRTIGQGGMGAVYQAKDVKRQQVVAVKEMGLSMVPPEDRAQAIQNFKIEARMLAHLHHPNLPTFYGFFSESQRYFMVMEYIDGLTLEELLEKNRGPFPERRVLGWARQLCDVLEYLHNQQPPIIFRDMKPGNVMVTRDGHTKLIDFGIARLFRRRSAQDTQLLGTPGFAPPEQYGTAQTDERSDIYSLAITLFQLLTNTLSEKGFGLRDIRAINPKISPLVAHALEKAAALEPEDRYNTIAEFRRALLGEGTFIFESGEVATTTRELAELCIIYPQEAADYLSAGEIEAWLREIGELELLRELRRICSLGDDPQESVAQLVQTILGSSARLRIQVPANYNGRGSKSSKSAASERGSQSGIAASAGSKAGTNGTNAGSRSSRSWLTRKPTSPIQVSPRILDFGLIHAEVSPPMIVTITGEQGIQVSGAVDSKDSWILLDQEQFDGSATRINVQVDARQLSAGHYSGQIIVTPYGEETQRPTILTIEAEVVTYPATTNLRTRKKPSLSPDLTDLDQLDFEEDLLLNRSDIATLPPPTPTTRKVGGQTGAQPALRRREQTGAQPALRRESSGQTGAQPALRRKAPEQMSALEEEVHSQDGLTVGTQTRDTDYINGYDPTTQQTRRPGRWDPVDISESQQKWMQRIKTGMAAFMLGALSYNLVARSFSVQLAPLPPNPWFIVVLALLVPASTLGALIVNWNRTWSRQDTINCATTGLASSLLVVALVKGLWQVTLHTQQPGLLLFLLLLLTAIAATWGTNQKTSENIIYWVSNIVARLHAVTVGLAVILGGALGYVLIAELAITWFTPLGILLGIGIAVNLVWRVDQLMKQHQQIQE